MDEPGRVWLINVWKQSETCPKIYCSHNFEAVEKWAEALGFVKTDPPCDRPDYDALYTRSDGFKVTVQQIKTIPGGAFPN